jgi:hypothetical protein
MNFWVGKKLIREGRWFKYYEMRPGVPLRISKFLSHETGMNASVLREEWVSWDESERLDFAQAFSLKPEITSQDEEILEFMMRSTDERIRSSIASCLTRHSNKQMVFAFLIEQLIKGSEPKANILQALTALGNRQAVPSIRALHDRLAADINPGEVEQDVWKILDFFAACAALDKLEGTISYRAEIEPFLKHPSESVRTMAKLWIDGGPPTR